MKRNLLVLLAALLPLVVDAYDACIDGIYYGLNHNSKTAIVTYLSTPDNNRDRYTGNVSIPESITHNGTRYNVTTIGDYAFAHCEELISVVIPNSVTSISWAAFEGCSGLKSITIPGNVRSIGGFAFTQCTNLTSIIISNGVMSIDHHAFAHCISLASITIPNSVTYIDEAAFEGCNGLTLISIPNSITSIKNYVFKDCSSLTSVSIPSNIASIGYEAFSMCDNLTSVTVERETPASIDETSFSNRRNATLYVPNGRKPAYEAASYWKEFKEIKVISDAAETTTYSIGSAQELVAFANKVNAGSSYINAVLTADIDLSGVSGSWIPIGSESVPFKGIFDGQGHTITNFEYTATSDCNGLFGVINNATVKNFSISGTLTSQKDWNGVVGRADDASVVSGIHSSLTMIVSNCAAHTGGVIGGSNYVQGSHHTVFVEGCEYSGILRHSGEGDCQAGIIGYTYGGGVKNCIFSGTIIGEDSKYGGILGYCKNVDFIGVQDCLSVGKIVADANCTTAAAIIGNWNGNATSKVKNNYYCLQDGSTTTIAIGNNASNCETPHAVTADQLASGEICYALNGDQKKINWYQTLGEDDFPVPDNSHLPVWYSNGLYSNEIPITIGSTGYATFCSRYPLDFSEVSGMKAYIASGFSPSTGKLVLTNVTEVPAGDGLYLVGEAGTYGVAIAETDMLYSNLLKGVTSATTIYPTDGDYTNFILANGIHGVAFYNLSEAGELAAGKAYLQLPTASVSEVKAISVIFDDDNEDGIESIQKSKFKNQDERTVIYNLQGQQVSTPKSGLYIINGKKVFIK